MSGKCYSLNDEDFNHDELGDLIAGMDDPKVGDVYWEADCRTVTSADAVGNVDHILEEMDQCMYEELGEVFGNDFSEAPQEAKDELNTLLKAWVEKHINLGRYWKIEGKSRECKLTAEDLEGGDA